MSIESYRRVIEMLPEATLIVSGDGSVLAANGAFAAEVGLDSSEVEGRPLRDFSSDLPEHVAESLRACSRTRRPVFGLFSLAGSGEELIRCRFEGALLQPRSGEDAAVLLIRLPRRQDSSPQFSVLNRRIDDLNREIARRMRVEEELRSQRELLRVTLTSIGDAVITTDVEGLVTFLNPVAETLTGWSTAGATGRPLEEVFVIVNEDSRAVVENPVAKVLRLGTIVGLANHTILIGRGGIESAIEDTAAPIREPGGELRGVVLVFHDVADRRALEKELIQRAEKLAENDRRKDEFLAMLAHELRNPLASINGAVRFLAPGEAEEDIGWAKEVVERQVRHLARLIDDLLDVSRITRGTIELRREPIDLSPTVAAAVEAVRPLIEERQHRLSVSLAPGAIRLEADPVRLEQILVNLLTNAAKYTPAGGRIGLDASIDGLEVVIRVTDTGSGIDPRFLPSMFELFAQDDRSIARSEGGLGIGLTIVRRLAEMHGGSAAARSEGPGLGSEFAVRLPALVGSEAIRAPAEAPRPLPRASDVGKRVLVVDDNLDTARGLAKLLKILGHEVRMAHDGPAALEEARSHRPEVVLLDIGLPGMDGYEVARQLRAGESCRDCLLVAISGYGQDEDRRRSQASGFDHHLVKPIEFDALLALIDADGIAAGR